MSLHQALQQDKRHLCLWRDDRQYQAELRDAGDPKGRVWSRARAEAWVRAANRHGCGPKRAAQVSPFSAFSQFENKHAATRAFLSSAGRKGKQTAAMATAS